MGRPKSRETLALWSGDCYNGDADARFFFRDSRLRYLNCMAPYHASVEFDKRTDDLAAFEMG